MLHGYNLKQAMEKGIVTRLGLPQKKALNAKDLANAGNREETNVAYIHVPVTDIAKARGELATIVTTMAVTCSMKVHSIVCVVHDSTIAVRSTSCYNECCRSELNWVLGCHGWKLHTLFLREDQEQEEIEEK